MTAAEIQKAAAERIRSWLDDVWGNVDPMPLAAAKEMMEGLAKAIEALSANPEGT